MRRRNIVREWPGVSASITICRSIGLPATIVLGVKATASLTNGREQETPEEQDFGKEWLRFNSRPSYFVDLGDVNNGRRSVSLEIANYLDLSDD